MDFVILSKLLLRKKWYLILIPVLAIVTTFLLTTDMQPEYLSTAKLATGFTTNERIVLANESFNMRDAEIKFNNLTQTMTSELMVSMMSYRLILNDLNSTSFRKPDQKVQVFLSDTERKSVPKILKEKLDSFTLLSNYDFTEKKLLKLLESYGYVNWMVERPLKVDWIKGSDYVEVQYISENPFLSAFIVNTLCEETIRYDNYLKSKRSDQSVTFFSNLVNDRKKVLNEKTVLLNNVMQGNTLSDFGEERPEKMNVIRSYEVRRAELLSSIQRLNLSIESLKKRMGESPSSSGKNETNANISSIRKRIEELSSEPEQRGAKGAAVQKEIKDLWAQLQAELSKLNSTNYAGNREDWVAEKEENEIELKVAQTDLASVNAMLETLRSGMSGAATKETTVTTLKLEVDKASEEYFETVNRFNTERSKALISSPLQLIISGQPNGSAEFPKRYLLLAFTALASFLLCLFVIVAIEYVDPRIKTREQFKRMVGLELAGTVNRIKTKNLNLNTLFSSRKSKDLEQFKGALRKIRFEMEQSKGRVFLVTSTKQNEGKTFMILCISFMLAMLKNKILIIDTNFHHNSLTQILLKNFTNVKKLEQWTGTPTQIGTPEPRTEDYKSEFIGSIVRSETHHWIDVLGNNGCDSSPSEIFAGKDFEHIISSLKEYYDYIILEGASLNNFSDSMELVNYVDKVIPVFSAESDIESQDKESIEYLKTLDGKLMSAILNKTNVRDLNAY